MAAEKLERIVQLVEALLGELVTAVVNPAEGLLQNGRAEVLLGVPPVRGARGGAARAENALVHAVKLGAVGLGLQGLFAVLGGLLALEPGLDGLVLIVKVVHVRNEVLDDVHVGERVDGGGGLVIDVGKAGQGVATVDVHGARAADALTARAAEGERRVLLVLDLDERIKDHGAALVQVDGVVHHGGLAPLLRVVPVDLKVLDLLGLLLHLELARGREGARAAEGTPLRASSDRASGAPRRHAHGHCRRRASASLPRALAALA
mmetsp:Transcript_22041/g.70405  ORF Transcript_22041/g.70405 Transcript_22041/m.70405 type:complete len:263 (+) Transcript_22041:183-971(+)